MADLFSTDVLTGVVASLLMPPSFFLDRYFPAVQTSATEFIHFDVMNKTRRLAPFVSPVREGKIVESQGRSVKTFAPAYVKDKRVFDPNRPMKRAAGEQIGGSLTPQQRIEALLAYELQDQIDMLARRQEVMAAEAIRLGQVTVEGEGYPQVVVDFGRSASLSFAAPSTLWSVSTAKPLADLRGWKKTILKTSGANATDVIMDADAWDQFSENAGVQKIIDLRHNVGSQLNISAPIGEGATYMGTIGGFDIYVYQGWYLDDSNVEQPILPSGTVILASAQVEGVRAYGAIQDAAAGYQATAYFPKSWVEQDPSVRYLLMQSAPLTVPYRPNATGVATVL